MPHPIKYKDGYLVNFVVGGRNGQRVRARFPSSQYPDAKAAAESFIRGKLETPDREHHQSDLAVRIRQYLNHAERIQQKSPKTLRGDIQRLKLFQGWAEKHGVKSVRQITTDTIRQFQQYYYDHAPFTDRPFLRRKPNTPATWEKYRQIVSTFLTWCLDRSLIRAHPMARRAEFRVKKQKTIPRALSPGEILALLTWFDSKDEGLKYPYHGAFFRTLLYSGLRLDEARNLKWQDIDLKAGKLRVMKSKNDEARTVPIHPDLVPYLAHLPDSTLYVFDNGRGQPLFAAVTWLKRLYAATEALGLPTARLHDLRHTFGANLAMAGVPLPTIMELIGHKNISSTMIYLHFFPEHLSDSIKKLKF